MGRVAAVNNNALVAALGSDAVAAVHGYRLEIVEQARLRGLTLRPARTGPGTDPIDIRLVFADGPGAPLTGVVLAWSPERGWSTAGSAADPSPRYLAGPLARPLDLVPTPADVLYRLTGQARGSKVPPLDVDLDDDPAAIRRLLRFATARHGRSSDALSLTA
jgi:hypothetical protein